MSRFSDLWFSEKLKEKLGSIKAELLDGTVIEYTEDCNKDETPLFRATDNKKVAAGIAQGTYKFISRTEGSDPAPEPREVSSVQDILTELDRLRAHMDKYKNNITE